MREFLSGRLSGDRLSRAEEHVSSCGDCCAAMAALPEERIAHRLREHFRDPSTPTTMLPAAADSPPSDVDENDPLAGLPDVLRDHPRYRVLRLVGIGGMGRVYQAEHRLMERTVALKVIDRRLLDQPMAAQRFEVEVKAAAKLDHPNIVRAFDAEHAGSTHFLVMEYVDGLSLAKLVKGRGPLDLQQACQCIRQAALGLQHAHEHGMVHRDIKPENLMLTRRGQVKILDFGLARLARDASPAQRSDSSFSSSNPGSSALTRIGSVFGTPAYIAPEQARDSGEVDIRADIYSLGCTLHFLATGKVPVRPQRHQKDATPPPPLALDRELIPAALLPILEKMTAASPAERYQAPRDVAEALAPLARKEGERRPVPWKRLAIGVGIAAAIAAPVIIIAASQSGSSTGPASPPNTANVPAPRPASPAPVAGKSVVLCVLPQQFHWADFSQVRASLERLGIQMKVASTGPCTPIQWPERSAAQNPIQPDFLLDRDNINTGEFAAIYFPGGYIFQYKDDSPARKIVWKLIEEMQAANKPIIALGHGQGVLAAKGLLNNRTVAANEQLKTWKPNYAGRFSNQRVVADGPYITGSDSADAQALAEQIAKVLKQR
jgi:serine/threonine protein kinase